MLISNAYAQADAATAVAGSGASSWLMIVVMVLVMWLFIIRPQAKRQQEHQNLINNLKKGDCVVTDSGLYGKVIKMVDDHAVEIELASNVEVKMLKSAISAVVDKSEAKKASTKVVASAKNNVKKTAAKKKAS